MSSASAGGSSDNTGEKNFAEVAGPEGQEAPRTQYGTTSTVAAEAQQGDGPAAASASGAALGATLPKTSAVSAVVGANGAAASCEFAAVAVSGQSAAAASQAGVAVVGPNGAAATCNAANGSQVSGSTRER